MAEIGTLRVKTGLAEMLKGGVIMDVVDAEQARIAEDAGACAVMALERVPADIRRDGGVARMSDPEKIREIQEAVSIPVMAKCRIGHFVEAQILESLGVDFVDESEVLTPADEEFHVDKHAFTVPFVCGARSSFASEYSSSSRSDCSRRIPPKTERMCVTALTMSPVPASPFVRIIAAPSAIRRSASPRFVQPQTNGTVNACLSTWCSRSAGVSTSDSSM